MTKIKIDYAGNLRTKCLHESGAQIETDAPLDNFGKGEAFSPTDLFAASLGSCMLTLMGIAARKLKVDLGKMSADVEKTMTTSGVRKIGKIIVRIRSSTLPQKHDLEKLERAAIDCPVHLSLHPEVAVEIDFLWGA